MKSRGLGNSRIDVLYDNNAIYACLIIGQNFARGTVSFERLRGNVHLKKQARQIHCLTVNFCRNYSSILRRNNRRKLKGGGRTKQEKATKFFVM